MKMRTKTRMKPTKMKKIPDRMTLNVAKLEQRAPAKSVMQ
jgi:hypothetical protein